MRERRIRFSLAVCCVLHTYVRVFVCLCPRSSVSVQYSVSITNYKQPNDNVQHNYRCRRSTFIEYGRCSVLCDYLYDLYYVLDAGFAVSDIYNNQRLVVVVFSTFPSRQQSSGPTLSMAQLYKYLYIIAAHVLVGMYPTVCLFV